MSEESHPDGKTLTKEEYESIIQNADFVERKPCEVTMVTDTKAAKEVWNSIFSKIKSSGETVRQSIHDAQRKWKSRPVLTLALLNTVEEKDLKCIALLSRPSEKVGYYVDLIFTVTPVMEQPYVKMLVRTLDQIALENETTIIIPKRYRAFTDDEDLVATLNEGLNVDATKK